MLGQERNMLCVCVCGKITELEIKSSVYHLLENKNNTITMTWATTMGACINEIIYTNNTF